MYLLQIGVTFFVNNLIFPQKSYNSKFQHIEKSRWSTWTLSSFFHQSEAYKYHRNLPGRIIDICIGLFPAKFAVNATRDNLLHVSR